MRRILFVDDDRNILDGLENTLRKERQRWNMAFALGGDAALAELQTAAYDVIVTDMRMPGMEGVTLLQKIKHAYPLIARIVLSGHADQDALIQTLEVAHQVLSKPCETDVLRGVVERLCDLQQMLPDENLRTVAGQCSALPSSAKAYRDLAGVSCRARPEVGDFAKIVMTDPAMAVKVLQIVNSAYFSPAQPVISIAHAVTYLGAELMQALVSSAKIFVIGRPDPCNELSLEKLQAHLLVVPELSRRFLDDPKCGDEAFAAALVRDIGRIVTTRTRVAEVTAPQLGSYLLGLWGLPRALVEVVRRHLRPGVESTDKTGLSLDVLAAVHAATALVNGGPLDLEFLERVGCSNRLAQWRLMAEAAKASVGTTRV